MSKRKFPASKPSTKYTHAECRQKVCIICFEAKGTQKSRPSDVSQNSNYISHLKKVIGENFDVNDQRQPCGFCPTCRQKYFSPKARESEVSFNILSLMCTQ